MAVSDKTSQSFSAESGGADGNTIHQMKVEDIPHFLQSRNLIPTPFGSSFGITSTSKNNTNDNAVDDHCGSSSNPKKEEICPKDLISTSLESSKNADVMTTGWKNHVNAVQIEIDQLICSSFFQQLSDNDNQEDDINKEADHTPLQQTNTEQIMLQSKIESYLVDEFGPRFTNMILRQSKEKDIEIPTELDNQFYLGERSLLNVFTFHDINVLLSELQILSTTSGDAVNISVSSHIQKWNAVQTKYLQSNCHVAHAVRLLSCAKKYDLPNLTKRSNHLCIQQKIKREQLENELIPFYKSAIDGFQQLQSELGFSIVSNDDVVLTVEKEEYEEGREFHGKDVVEAIPRDEMSRLCEEIEQMIAVVLSEGIEDKEDAVGHSGKLLEAMNYYKQFTAAIVSITSDEKAEDNITEMKDFLPTLYKIAKELDASKPLSVSAENDNKHKIEKQESYLLSKSTRSGLIDDLKELNGFVSSRLFEEHASHEGGGESGGKSFGAAGSLSILQNINSSLPAVNNSNVATIPPHPDVGTNMTTINKLEEYKAFIQNMLNKLTSGRFAILSLMNEDVSYQSMTASRLSSSFHQIKKAKKCVEVSKQNLENLQKEAIIVKEHIQLLDKRMNVLREALEQEIGSVVFGDDKSKKEGWRNFQIDL